MGEASATPIAAWARRYIETFGMALVPIEPGEKAPKGNGWNQPGGYITEAAKAEAFWTANPQHNMGVVLGPSRVCSLDVDHVEYCRTVMRDVLDADLDKIAAEHPTLVGNPARFRVMFALPEGVDFSRRSLSWPNPKDPDGSQHKQVTLALKVAREAGDAEQVAGLQAQQKALAPVTVLELRAGLVQDVLPPSIHPDTGKPYFWRNPPSDGLPELPGDLVRTWQHWDAFKRMALEACPWAPVASVPVSKPLMRPAVVEGDRPSVIDAYNRATNVESLLQQHGYQRRGKRWLAPQSSSGLPGVNVLVENGCSRVFSHHGADPLANGHMNDAFEVFCILEHHGDAKAATKAAARVLGIEYQRPAGNDAAGGELPPTPTAEAAATTAGGGEGMTLLQAKRRFALIEPTTSVWDQDKRHQLKKTAFEALVGKPLATEWYALGDKRLVPKEQVAEFEAAKKLARKKETATDLPPLERYVYIDGTKEAWDKTKKRRLPEGALKMALGDGYGLWVNSPQRRVVDVEHIVFDPTMTKDPATYINTFEGLPLEPVRDDDACANLRWLIGFLCNGHAKAAQWLTRWLAYPLQHTGAKMDTAVLMHSIMEGSGKSLLFSVVMGQLYGQYAATVGQTQLEGNFNAWQSGKLWAVFEEVVSRDQRYNQVGKIKQLITGTTVRIESKFVNGWEESSHMNAVFLSNEIMPWPISETDRRFLVMWPEETLPPERQQAIKHELANGGVAALYAWLLAVDLGDFDQQTKPPVTEARERLVALSRAAWQTFLHLWRTDELGMGLWGMCLSTDLYALFLEWCARNKEHAMSQTKFSLFISTSVEKLRPTPWRDGDIKGTRRFGAFFVPPDKQAFLPPSVSAGALGAHVATWRERAKTAGWGVDSWEHVKYPVGGALNKETPEDDA